MKLQGLDIAQIVRMRKAGFTYKEIASKFDVNWTVIRYHCHRLDVRPEIKVFRERKKRGRVLDGREEEIRNMYWDQQISVNDIARLLGVGKSTVFQFMYAHGIPTRDQKDATTLKFNSDYPPRRDGSRAWNSEQAREMANLSWEVRRKKDDKRRRRAEQRRRRIERKASAG